MKFSQNSTISLGYNSIRYDDEISRNGFYRNLLPVYEREWKNNCSRWDIIPVVRMYAFLYPNEINIPTDEEGKPSFRLEKLSVANGFVILLILEVMLNIQNHVLLLVLVKLMLAISLASSLII